MKIIDLLESKSAPLYHATPGYAAEHIMKIDTLKGYTHQYFNNKGYVGISTTRDFNFAVAWGKRKPQEDGFVIFKLDQQKLSQRYKLVPIDYHQSTLSTLMSKKYRRKGAFSEAEEFIITKEISNFSSYVLEIFVSHYAVEYFKSESSEFLNDPRVKLL